MTYRINGKEVTKEEFSAGAVGFDFGKPSSFQVGSFQPFQSPVDGSMINNRKELSAHNREHDVEQVGDEHKNNREQYNRETREEEAFCEAYQEKSGNAMDNPLVKERIKQLKEKA